MALPAALFALAFARPSRLPGQLVIQISNRCNGSCPQCGMRREAEISRVRLPAETVKKALRDCAENGVEAVSFTGGEPFINIPEILDLLDYAGGLKIPYLRSGTNGYMFAPGGKAAGPARLIPFVESLVKSPLRNFWISMDSADTETHERLRGLPGVIGGIVKALPEFHARGLYPAVNLGINRFIAGELIPPLGETGDEGAFLESFRRGFDAFFAKAASMGFTMANVCYPMSFETADPEAGRPAYGAISDDIMVSFSRRELRLVFGALLETIPVYRKSIRIFTPLSVLYALSRENSRELLFPCLGGICYFYMDSRDGHIYPCGYRGDEDMGASVAELKKPRGGQKPFCKKCHWECFMDPSQLFGIFRYVIRHPFRTFSGKAPDRRILRLWLGDIKYYLDCGFFDGRKPPKRRQEFETVEPLQNGGNDLQADEA
ncbi:MAG: radical SAM protein [Treponema sp.]|jgi:MoaA/NifB/PqqE/SkfB family radical SAM enzyme|nr:radical SAM protein [Treponema sp.]